MMIFHFGRFVFGVFSFFFFNDTATTEIYTLSLHDALPISYVVPDGGGSRGCPRRARRRRSEEHTSELQSRQYLVCRLLLEKKKNIQNLDTNKIIDMLIHVRQTHTDIL